MARTLLNGSEQIAASSIPWAAMVAGAIVPLAAIINSGQIVLSTGATAMGANWSMGGFLINNLGTPAAAGDAVTKAYVDALINGLTFHPAAKVVATANQAALSGLATIDGYTTLPTDRVLLTAQTTGAQNGPWVIAAGAWTRPADWAAASSQKEGAYFLIDPDGASFKNTKWYCSNTGAITPDTTATTWSQDLSGTLYSAGNGVLLTGTVFSAKLGNGLAFDGSSNIAASIDAARLLQSVAGGLGIKDGTAGQIVMANASLNASYQTMSGDVTITPGGVTAVNHTSGSGFAKYGDFIWNEVPGGAVNGVNTAFTLATAPSGAGAALELMLNGVMLEPGSGNDFTISGTAITMLFAPATGDKLRAYYLK